MSEIGLFGNIFPRTRLPPLWTCAHAVEYAAALSEQCHALFSNAGVRDDNLMLGVVFTRELEKVALFIERTLLTKSKYIRIFHVTLRIFTRARREFRRRERALVVKVPEFQEKYSPTAR